ncbi:adenylosuccinate lyase [Brumimicrobium salinarum]|uniref:Adenylosuccinate lyase n=1 Tax=Brumimicrobium salinarum TaxID=2058658 RepID=A0A2I0R3T7_9FLAO|nr:adenylosuccinate lyase [Brumimicrobium salinarum]PKR81241.1 adenylosuccinate lyase [Brumimicrobium salinarum]
MELNALNAITPIDGRYRRKVKELSPYFSEFGLIKYRVLVEVEYFIALVNSGIQPLSDFPKDRFSDLKKIYEDFTESDAQTIKDTEKVTNHDVKAVEYFVKDKLEALNLSEYIEFIHFGLTSQDINNTAVPLSMKHAIEEIYLPELNGLMNILEDYAKKWADISMLAKTHGQPASPTRLGKEILVFHERLDIQKKQLLSIPFSAKFGGATGNLNAHHVAFPNHDWAGFANHFVSHHLQLTRSQTTTQIEHYDNIAALFDAMKRINSIIIDLNRDMWTYISMDYFKQKLKEGEVGSSAMPHKVNPIDFENSEGNLGISSAILAHLAGKLPISRLQRDLTDSTVLRNVGVPFGHTLIGFKSTQVGLKKLLLNEKALFEDLENNWAVVAEAIQTILRREGFSKPYEALKGLTRKNEKITQATVHSFVDTLSVSDAIKAELKAITPHNYTGI